ncbi:MAG: hypothetical protein AAFU85_21335 [Planctomycetota bacterium]
MNHRISVLILTSPLVLLCWGCASWSDRGSHVERESVDAKPAIRGSRSIEVESNFVQIRFDPAKPDQLQSIWQWVDETVIPADKRVLLARNGLRVGRVAQQDRLEARVEEFRAENPPDVIDQFLASASVSSHQSEGTDRIPLRIGKRKELPVRSPIEGEQVVLLYDGEQLVGETLRDPQFLFAVTAERGSLRRTMRLRLRPEVQHGEMEQSFVAGGAAMRIDVRRPAWSLEPLEFDLPASEGDLFVITETASRRGLGRQMFGGKNVDQLEQQTMVLLRIAHIPRAADKL